MKMSKTVSTALLLGLMATVSAHAAELRELKVLYVGSERASAYVDFLSGKVAQIEAKSREGFDVRDAAPFDVILLDWPQAGGIEEHAKSQVSARPARSMGKADRSAGKCGTSSGCGLETQRRLRLHLHGSDGI